MPDITNLNVDSEHPVPVEPGTGTTVILAQSGDTVYYGATAAVSATNNIGSLTAGQSVTVTAVTYLISASSSSVVATTTPTLGTGQIGAYKAATTLGSVTGRVAYYDANNNLLGYIPLYGSIT